MELTIACRLHEASRLADEHMALFEAIGDPALTVGLTFIAIVLRHETGEPGEMLRLAQRMIDLAAGDPAMGGLILGSPLAVALAWRGVARWCLGRPGWHEDFEQATAVARGTDPMLRRPSLPTSTRWESRTGCYSPMRPPSTTSMTRCSSPNGPVTSSRWL